MASSLQTGLTAASYQRYLRGPGKVYKNFTSIAVPGTLLGATKGGTEFSWGLGVFNIQPDGSLGLIKNHRVVNSCIPTMKVNLMEWTSTNFPGSVPGGDTTNETPTSVRGEYLGTGAEITVGVGLGGGSVLGAVDESTLVVHYAATGGGVIPTLAALNTDYAMLDTITFVSVTGSESLVIGGITYTAASVESTGLHYFAYDSVGAPGDAACAASLATCIDADYATHGVSGSSALGVVYCTRAVAGTPTTIVETETSMTLDFQVVFEVSTGSIAPTDDITATYTYDSAAGTGVYQILKPGIIAAADYWDNVTLVCELSNQTYSNPYIVYQIKNCLPAPDPVTIPGEYPGETMLSVLYEGSFDPASGLTMAYAPVEAWLGRS